MLPPSSSSFSNRSFTIRVPATSANIGPGFDVVGLSLSLWLTLTVSLPSTPSNSSLYVPPKITYTGEGSSSVPLDPYKNLTTRVALYVLRCHEANGQGIPSNSFPSSLSIHCDNQIPFGRGLGSSGAAVLAGILLANQLYDLKLTKGRILDYALMVERHPDNVTAALVGGFVGSYLRELDEHDTSRVSVPLSEVLPEYPEDAGEDWGLDPPPHVPPHGIGHYVRFGWSQSVKALVVVPRFELSTARAREVLPDNYSRKDLVFNLQRLAVLTTALGQTPPDPELIYEAMKDRVHQPYRKSLIPGLPLLLTSLTPTTHPGLLGVCLSGAGPTVLILFDSSHSGLLAASTSNQNSNPTSTLPKNYPHSIAEHACSIFESAGVVVDVQVLEVCGGSEVIEEQT